MNKIKTRRAKKQRDNSSVSEKPKVSENEVILVEGKSSRKSHEGSTAYHWHIYLGNERVGRAIIHWVDLDSFAPHASITVELYIKNRGRGIGTIVFRRACELSQYNEVYASIRKSNIASRIAAERAGFKPVENWEGRELFMVWRRNPQYTEG
jgi:RimJ/RimL family protein N-acetyltransferase